MIKGRDVVYLILLLCLLTNGTDAIIVYDLSTLAPHSRSGRRAIHPMCTHKLHRWHYSRLSPLLYYIHIVLVLLQTLRPMACNPPMPVTQCAGYCPQVYQWCHPTVDPATCVLVARHCIVVRYNAN